MSASSRLNFPFASHFKHQKSMRALPNDSGNIKRAFLICVLSAVLLELKELSICFQSLIMVRSQNGEDLRSAIPRFRDVVFVGIDGPGSLVLKSCKASSRCNQKCFGESLGVTCSGLTWDGLGPKFSRKCAERMCELAIRNQHITLTLGQSLTQGQG